MVRQAEHHAWSSAAAHRGLRDESLLSLLLRIVPVRTEDWSAWPAEKDDEKMPATIRHDPSSRSYRTPGRRQEVYCSPGISRGPAPAAQIHRPSQEGEDRSLPKQIIGLRPYFYKLLLFGVFLWIC
jgi:hypothetical protein